MDGPESVSYTSVYNAISPSISAEVWIAYKASSIIAASNAFKIKKNLEHIRKSKL